jgi:hypothetical protein
MLNPIELTRYFNFWEETMIFLKCLSNGDLWCPSFVGKMVVFGGGWMGFDRWSFYQETQSLAILLDNLPPVCNSTHINIFESELELLNDP